MTKTSKIIYWISTAWLALGMISTGGTQLVKAKEGPGAVDSMIHLGYPLYFLTILAVWKILGAITILIPKFPLLKEWAYAGFFFAMSGAIFSHMALGDPAAEIFPALLLLVLTVVSWYFRPAGRKAVSVNQSFQLATK
ncbi:MAG TPA: DoxX family protein [Chitinophaga sp.]|uniref:DoxX family protein n=1 Tax=Chitinophaga sp. TaxID=1869181 RepID=UPI002DBFB898|nr:DoxX family protein [Chitinophaga sp.]HEU4554327.1 DoxX family protein [Chitinophaga sp.]